MPKNKVFGQAEGGAALKIKFFPNLTFVSTGRAVLA